MVPKGSSMRWVSGCLFAGLVAAASIAAAEDTPLVRSVYDAPLPADPMALWDRVADLHWLNRVADSKTLEAYLERTAVALILGEPSGTPATLEQLLRSEKTTPALDPALISRVLAQFDGALDDSTDAASIPKDYRGQVQYHYEGHSVWSQLRNSREAYLHVRLTNHSAHDVSSLSSTVRIVRNAETILIPCQADIRSVLHSGATAGALCPTVQVTSTARPGFYTLIETSTLIELIETVERGDATLSVEPGGAYFPEYSVDVSSTGVQPVNVSLRPRTFPLITNVTCEDRGTCAAERSEKWHHMLFNPLWLLLATLFAGCVIGYALLRAVLVLGGGTRALPVARLISGLVVITSFAIAAWNVRALNAYRGEGWGSLPYFLVMIGAGLFGIGVLVATLLVGSRPAPLDASSRP
jgi:hypothetical protein